MAELNHPPLHFPVATTPQLLHDFNDNPTAISALGSSEESKLFESALLANAERNQLLVEIFTYFKWLEQNLILLPDGGQRASNAGFTINGVKQVMLSLEAGFKSVRDNALTVCRVAEGLTKDGKAPFLEKQCDGELKKRTQEMRLEPATGEGLEAMTDSKTWNDRYGELLQHRSTINDCSRQELNECSEGLGDWLQKQRSLYAKQDLDFMKIWAPKLDAAGFVWWREPPPKKAKRQLMETPAHMVPMQPTLHQQDQQHHRTPEATPRAAKPEEAPKPPIIMQRIPMITTTAAKPKKSSPKPRTAARYDFETQFNELLDYKAEHGDCLVPYNSRLGRWVHTVRLKFREMNGNEEVDNCSACANRPVGAAGVTDKANAFRIFAPAPPGRLGVAVKFSVDKAGAEVTAIFEACPLLNKVRKGDFIVSIDGKSITKPEDLSIGLERQRTVCIMRKKKRKGSGPDLTQEQVERLNSIGFHWKKGGKFRSWDDSYQDLLKYYQAHGETRVPRTYLTENGGKLGEWVHRQRYRHHIKEPSFMIDKAPKLDSIGFEWKPRKIDFQTNFRELVRYKKVHGHVNVPWNNNNNNEYRMIGRWCASLRFTRYREEEKRKRGEPEEEEKRKHGGHHHEILSAERIKLLDSLGFDWTLKRMTRPH